MTLTAMMALTAFARCGEKKEEAAPAATSEAAEEASAKALADGEALNIDVILKTTSAEYWQYVMAGAEAAGEAAKEAGWEEIKCIEIAGVQGDETNTARMNGYRAGVNENGGEFLDDEVQYADAIADKAVTSMEAIMQKFPEGIAIICANNDDMAMAAARAAKGNEAYANTIFLGFNGDRAACEAILAGEETMSVIQDAYGMGYKAVEAAIDYMNGAELESFIDSGSGVATKDNSQARLDEVNYSAIE